MVRDRGLDRHRQRLLRERPRRVTLEVAREQGPGPDRVALEAQRAHRLENRRRVLRRGRRDRRRGRPARAVSGRLANGCCERAARRGRGRGLHGDRRRGPRRRHRRGGLEIGDLGATDVGARRSGQRTRGRRRHEALVGPFHPARPARPSEGGAGDRAAAEQDHRGRGHPHEERRPARRHVAEAQLHALLAPGRRLVRGLAAQEIEGPGFGLRGPYALDEALRRPLTWLYPSCPSCPSVPHRPRSRAWNLSASLKNSLRA